MFVALYNLLRCFTLIFLNVALSSVFISSYAHAAKEPVLLHKRNLSQSLTHLLHSPIRPAPSMIDESEIIIPVEEDERIVIEQKIELPDKKILLDEVAVMPVEGGKILVVEKEMILPLSPVLSYETKKTIDHLVNYLDHTAKKKKEITHYTLQKDNGVLQSSKSTTQEMDNGAGMRISIQKKATTLPLQEQLENAYQALIMGQLEVAEHLYKAILRDHSDHNLAQLGLATVLQKNNQYKEALHLYGKILHKNPEQKEALTNFLALIAKESPDEALHELEKLAKVHPYFSPVLAQIAMIYAKKNLYSEASHYLNKALIISPDNLIYRYNLAILMDQSGKRDQAESHYRSLLEAGLNGTPLPVSLDSLQERLLLTESPSYL